jgi:GR25 family glycosyltransferase involved in LPS biosynthesis
MISKTKISIGIFFLVLILLTLFCITTSSSSNSTPIVWELGITTSPTKIGNYEIDFVAISLPKRKSSHFSVLQAALKKNNIEVAYFEAIDGKTLKYEDYNLAPRYIEFFENNRKERESGKTMTDFRGHFGATISHINVIKATRGTICILEDDADLVADFREKLEVALKNLNDLDPNFDVLLLGGTAQYNHHFYHKLNDHEPIVNGLVKIHHFIGAWGYILRDKSVAKKVLSFFEPINWHIDLTIAEQTRLGNLNTYIIFNPTTIALHPGLLRISSFDYTQVGAYGRYRSDTNN